MDDKREFVDERHESTNSIDTKVLCKVLAFGLMDLMEIVGLMDRRGF